MSRLGKMPIPLPDKVEVKIADGMVHVRGPKGNLSIPAPKGISVQVENNLLTVLKSEDVEMPKPTHGLYRALINNMVLGVTTGFERRLGLVGVGYRAAVQGQKLDLQLGFSHPTQIPIPKGVNVTVDKSVTIIIQGVDKH